MPILVLCTCSFVKNKQKQFYVNSASEPEVFPLKTAITATPNSLQLFFQQFYKLLEYYFFWNQVTRPGLERVNLKV